MRKPDKLIIDGRAYSWRRLVEARRHQLEAWRALAREQPVLFEMKQDCRPIVEKTSAMRYREPTFFDLMKER